MADGQLLACAMSHFKSKEVKLGHKAQRPGFISGPVQFVEGFFIKLYAILQDDSMHVFQRDRFVQLDLNAAAEKLAGDQLVFFGDLIHDGRV